MCLKSVKLKVMSKFTPTQRKLLAYALIAILGTVLAPVTFGLTGAIAALVLSLMATDLYPLIQSRGKSMNILTLEQALDFVDEQLRAHRKGQGLKDLERVILEGIWKGIRFNEIAKSYPDVTQKHIETNVAPQLYKTLTNITGEKVRKNNLKNVISQACQRQQKMPDIEMLVQETRAKIKG